MATTKLILTHDVPNLGHAGEVVEVKAVARNYLVPAASPPSGPPARKQIDQIAAARRRHEIATIDDARAVRDASRVPLSRSPLARLTSAACSAPSPLLRSLTRSRSSWARPSIVVASSSPRPSRPLATTR